MSEKIRKTRTKHLSTIWLDSFFHTPLGVSRVVWGAHLRWPAPWVTWLFEQWMLQWWPVSGSNAREPFPCAHPLTPNTRLSGQQVLFFKSSVWPDQDTLCKSWMKHSGELFRYQRWQKCKTKTHWISLLNYLKSYQLLRRGHEDWPDF